MIRVHADGATTVTVALVVDALIALRDYLRRESCEDLDVRLVADGNGVCHVATGDASFDVYHGRYCGAGTLGCGDNDGAVRALAADLIDQVADQIAEGQS